MPDSEINDKITIESNRGRAIYMLKEQKKKIASWKTFMNYGKSLQWKGPTIQTQAVVLHNF